MMITNNFQKANTIMNERADQIVFIHGLADFSKSWRQLREWLDPAGYQIHFYDYPTFDNALQISDVAAELNEYIQLAVGDQPFQIVAHSQGGLIAEWYDQFYPDHPNLLRIITIATPFHGNSLPLIARNWLDHIPFSRTQIQHLCTFSLIMKRLLRRRLADNASATPYFSIIGRSGELFGIEGDLVVAVCEGNRDAQAYRLESSKMTPMTYAHTPQVIIKNSHLPASFLQSVLTDQNLFREILMRALEGDQPETIQHEPLKQAGLILPAAIEQELVLPDGMSRVISRMTADPQYTMHFIDIRQPASEKNISVKGHNVLLKPGMMTYILNDEFFRN